MKNYTAYKFISSGFKNNSETYRSEGKNKVTLKSTTTFSNHEPLINANLSNLTQESITFIKSIHDGLYYAKIDTLKGETLVLIKVSNDLGFLNVIQFSKEVKPTDLELEKILKSHNSKWNEH